MKKQILVDDLEQLETKEYTKLTPILVPENWEELKNLCNENNLEILADIIYTNALSFHKNGDIKDNENSMVAVNRTPQQMWAIIKNLIGE